MDWFYLLISIAVGILTIFMAVCFVEAIRRKDVPAVFMFLAAFFVFVAAFLKVCEKVFQ